MVEELQVVLFSARSSTQGTHKHQFERHKGGWSQVAWGGTFHAVWSWLSSKIGQHHLEGAAIGVKLLSHCLPGKPRYGRLNKSLGFYCPTEILHADGDHVLRGQLSSLLELNVILDVVRRNCNFCPLNLGHKKRNYNFSFLQIVIHHGIWIVECMLGARLQKVKWSFYSFGFVQQKKWHARICNCQYQTFRNPAQLIHLIWDFWISKNCNLYLR